MIIWFWSVLLAWLDYIYVYKYIVMHRQIRFVLSELISVVRQARFRELGSKPGWLKRQSKILPLSHKETNASGGNLNGYESQLLLFIYIRLYIYIYIYIYIYCEILGIRIFLFLIKCDWQVFAVAILTAFSYPIYQPLRSGRIWHKVNFLAEFDRFEFRVFLLLVA